MSLLKLLRDEYSAHENYQKKNFIPFEDACQIVTRKRIDDWSQSHPLCLEHGSSCSEKDDLIGKILHRSIYLFVVLVFAKLEVLTKKLLARDCGDHMLFNDGRFERYCKSAELKAEQVQSLAKNRSYIGVLFNSNHSQDVSKDAVLPFLKREQFEYGSFGSIYRVTIPAHHLQGFNSEVRCFVLVIACMKRS